MAPGISEPLQAFLYVGVAYFIVQIVDTLRHWFKD